MAIEFDNAEYASDEYGQFYLFGESVGFGYAEGNAGRACTLNALKHGGYAARNDALPAEVIKQLKRDAKRLAESPPAALLETINRYNAELAAEELKLAELEFLYNQPEFQSKGLDTVLKAEEALGRRKDRKRQVEKLRDALMLKYNELAADGAAAAGSIKIEITGGDLQLFS